jgi:hypothetical protein
VGKLSSENSRTSYVLFLITDNFLSVIYDTKYKKVILFFSFFFTKHNRFVAFDSALGVVGCSRSWDG